MFVTSWYVNVPAIETLPENVPLTAEISPEKDPPANVDTPDTTRPSVVVVPVTSTP